MNFYVTSFPSGMAAVAAYRIILQHTNSISDI